MGGTNVLSKAQIDARIAASTAVVQSEDWIQPIIAYDPVTGLPLANSLTFVSEVVVTSAGSAAALSAAACRAVCICSWPTNTNIFYIAQNGAAATAANNSCVLPDGYASKWFYVTNANQISTLGTSGDKLSVAIYK